MPITKITSAVLVPIGDGDGTPARIPTCLNCHRPVVPCQCRLIDGQRCAPPFRGLVHLDTNSHLCSFPQPGTRFAEEVAENE